MTENILLWSCNMPPQAQPCNCMESTNIQLLHADVAEQAGKATAPDVVKSYLRLTLQAADNKMQTFDRARCPVSHVHTPCAHNRTVRDAMMLKSNTVSWLGLSSKPRNAYQVRTSFRNKECIAPSVSSLNSWREMQTPDD